jgi:hypothetical protein
MKASTIASILALALATPAFADVTVTRTAGPAPTYATSLNFDEAGGPSGSNVPTNSWAPIGLSNIDIGVGGGGFVGNLNGTFPWMPDNNVYGGAFGVFMNFSGSLSEFSSQIWDSGAAGPFGGGLGVVVLNDNVELAFETWSDTPWGGIGDTWFNITTTDGTVFDEVRIVGFGFNTETYVDNMSWNAVPAPAALALLAFAGLLGSTRRRR